MAKPKKIPVEIKVSIPHAGEFTMVLRLDPDEVVGKHGGFDYGAMTAKEIKEAIAAALEFVAKDKIKVTPLKGELVKAEAAFQRHLVECARED